MKLLLGITELTWCLIWRSKINKLKICGEMYCTSHIYIKNINQKCLLFSINLKLKIVNVVNLFIWGRKRLFQSKLIFMSTTDLPMRQLIWLLCTAHFFPDRYWNLISRVCCAIIPCFCCLFLSLSAIENMFSFHFVSFFSK